MKKLEPLHYWLLITALVLSNIIWICTTLDVAKQRDELKIFIKDQKETIDGLYEILEYKDSLINNQYICNRTEFCD
jgi:hypothetical protein